MATFLNWVLLLLFLVINTALLIYFLRKYRETGLRTSLYWVLTYTFFVFALVASLVILIISGDFEDAVSIQVPFVLMGLTMLSMSALSTGFLGEWSERIEYFLGTVGLLGFIAYLISYQDLAAIVLILMSLVSIFSYFYLAYSGTNYRIAVISVGLLLQALSGRLSTTDVIDANGQLFFNFIGQLLIAVGLLGIGLKRLEN